MTPQLKTLLETIHSWMLDNDYECGHVGAEIFSEIQKVLDADQEARHIDSTTL